MKPMPKHKKSLVVLAASGFILLLLFLKSQSLESRLKSAILNPRPGLFERIEPVILELPASIREEVYKLAPESQEELLERLKKDSAVHGKLVVHGKRLLNSDLEPEEWGRLINLMAGVSKTDAEILEIALKTLEQNHPARWSYAIGALSEMAHPTTIETWFPRFYRFLDATNPTDFVPPTQLSRAKPSWRTSKGASDQMLFRLMAEMDSGAADISRDYLDRSMDPLIKIFWAMRRAREAIKATFENPASQPIYHGPTLMSLLNHHD